MMNIARGTENGSLVPTRHTFFKHLAWPTDAEVWLPESETVWVKNDTDWLHYVLTVLRAKPGQGFRLMAFNPASPLLALDVEVLSVERKTVQLGVLHRCTTGSQAVQQAAPFHLTLCLPILKETAWEWLLQKATELGVTTIQPISTEFSQASVAHPSENKLKRWHSIIQQAALQSERWNLPLLQPVKPFSTCLSAALVQPNSLVLACVERALQYLPQHAAPLPALNAFIQQNQAVKSVTLSNVPVVLFLGPEGGWSPEETHQLLNTSGVQSVHLGTHILKAETAALAALSAFL